MRLLILVLFVAAAIAAKPSPEPFTVTERFHDVNLNGCVGEDDRLRWKLSGTLAPGESVTFTPGETLVPEEGIPICDRSGRGLAAFVSWAKRGGKNAGPVSQYLEWGDNTYEGVAICQKLPRLDGKQFPTLTFTNEGIRRVYSIEGWGEIVNRSSLQFVAGCP
jgi:hypothetical protein